MNKMIVSRDERYYKCFPDIAKCKDGTLVCVYRECMHHAAYPFSRIIATLSHDGGMSWSIGKTIMECIATEDSVRKCTWLLDDDIAAYEEAKARISDPDRVDAYINTSRIICLNNGQLMIAVDTTCRGKNKNLLYRSDDNGNTWNGPEDTGICDAIVPSLNELKNGTIMLGLTRQSETSHAQGVGLHEEQLVYFSNDRGKTWSEPVAIPHIEGQDFSEGSFIELDSGTILGILRDDKLGRGYKVLSYDGGYTWKGPFPTQLIGLNGRPKTGLLRSGEICITYRAGLPNEMLALHTITQKACEVEGEYALIERLPIPEEIESMRNDANCPWYMKEYYPGRTLILDMDRSVHRDSGYAGWVQLDSGDLLVIDYINDDAPRAHIRSYLVSRSDIILFPEGDLPWLHPSAQPWLKMTYGMSERQYRKVGKS